MEFFKVLLIIIVSFYLLGLIGRIMLRRYLKKMQKRMEEFQRQQQGGYDPRQEGEIEVKVKPKKNKQYKQDDGDYVDFEEVDE